jgi:secreted trypsin-like serine protease
MMIFSKKMFAVSALQLHPSGRIFGGEPAKPGQFPFVVSLNNKVDGPWCGASVIDKKWAVTAAHCLQFFTADFFYILAGTTLLDAGGTNYTVVSIVTHPDFDDSILTNDLALLQIQDEFVLDGTTQPIGIGDVSGNESCTALGWGSTANANGSNELQFVNLTALTDEDCTKLAQGGKFVFERGPGQVCTLGGEGEAVCYGDSGGPLVCGGELVGVVSYGITPCAKGFPDVFTRLAFYQDWIKNVVNSESVVHNLI